MNLPTHHALSSQPVTPADAFGVSDDCFALIYYAAHLAQNPPAHPNSRVLFIMTRNHESAVREVLEDAKRRSFEVTDAADLLRRSHPELADELYELGTKDQCQARLSLIKTRAGSGSNQAGPFFVHSDSKYRANSLGFDRF